MVLHRIPVQRAISGALVVLLALLAAHYAGAPLPWPHVADWLYQLVEAGAAAACLLGDALLLGLVAAAMMMTGGHRDRHWLAIGAAFAIFAVVDSVYLYQSAAGTYATSTILDAGWPGAMVILALAAGARPRPAQPGGRTGWRAFAVPGASGLVALALEIYDHYHRLNEPALWLASLCLLAFVGRLALTFHDNL